MTVYVDNAAIPHSGKIWYHMISDNDTDEIHELACKIGLLRDWYQSDHYDVTTHKRNMAIKAGAIPIDVYEAVKIRKAKRS